jgi:hypothetical protein
MFKNLLIVSLMMVSANVALAEVSETPTQTRAQVRERSSEHYRMDKNFEMTFSPMSFGGFSLTNTGLNAGVFINRNSQVLVSYSWSQSERTCVGFENCDIKDNFWGLAYKRFVGNSFYMQAGASHHTIQYDESNSSNDVMFGYDATITTADFAVGNQWNFDGFTIGCDWVSFGLPVSSSFSNSYYNSPYTEDDVTNRQDEWKKNGRMIFAKLYLGGTF